MKNPLRWTAGFRALARRHSGRTALTDDLGSVTYDDLMDHGAGITDMVRRLPGFGPGTPIATFLPNGRLAAWTSIGITMAGAAETAINPHLSEADLVHALKTAGAHVLLTTEERKSALSALPEAVPGLTILDAATIPRGDIGTLAEVDIDPECWGKILFTSGTTGRPKGIVHGHGGRWIANLMLRASLPIAPGPDLDLLLLTPFSHGASLMAYAYLEGGARVTLLDGLDPADVLTRLRDGRCNQVFAPPTVLARLMAAHDGSAIGGVHTIFTGTAPLSKELYQKVREAFGPVVRITYGKTEMFNPITVLTPSETDAWYSGPQQGTTCVGWPVSGVDVRMDGGPGPDPEAKVGEGVAEEGGDDGASAEGGIVAEPGAILLRSPHQMIGTLIDGTFHPQRGDEYHRSGDIGFLDGEGRLHLSGRESDIIKSGGYRIAPEEVEAALRPALPDADMVVLGLPSEHWGEVVIAVAAAEREDWHAPLGDTVANMTGYKRPRLFARLDRLPRNAMGKVSRNEVRQEVLEHYEFTDGRYPGLGRKP